jgi:hypothetical protein
VVENRIRAEGAQISSIFVRIYKILAHICAKSEAKRYSVSGQVAKL